MANNPIIEDAYIDDIIKSAGSYDPSLTTTQGVKLRELIKLMRDRIEQAGTGEGIKNQITSPQTAGFNINGDGTLKILNIASDGTAGSGNVPAQLFVTADQKNTATTATYLTSSTSGARIYLGSPSKPIALDFTNVTFLNGMPTFLTSDIMTWGYGVGSHNIGRNGADVYYNSSSPGANAGDHIFYGRADNYASFTNNIERMRIRASDGAIVIPGQTLIATAPTLPTHSMRLTDMAGFAKLATDNTFQGDQRFYKSFDVFGLATFRSFVKLSNANAQMLLAESDAGSARFYVRLGVAPSANATLGYVNLYNTPGSTGNALGIENSLQANPDTTASTVNYMPLTDGVIAVISDLPKMFTYTLSGDGSTTVFRIPTGLSSPTVAVVSASSGDARGKVVSGTVNTNAVNFYSIVDGTNVVLNYATAPAAGTNNLTWSIFVK